MAAKFNKDMLLKHRFWILLSVTVLLSLVGLVWLQTANADALMAEVKKELDLTQKNAKSPQQGPDSLVAIGKEAEKAKDTEAKVWHDAYKDQANIFRWSKPIEDTFQFSTGKFANEVAAAKVAEREAWPDDPAGGVHGALQSVEDDYLVLSDRNKKSVKIYRTKHVKITGGDDKTLEWPDLDRYKNKLLQVKFQTGKIFNDPLRGEELDVFKDSYLKQVDEILQTVEPFDEKGNGTVQLKNWLYSPEWVERFRTERKPDDSMKFIRFVTIPWDNTGKNFSEEAWIAQENIWIQRELYRIIRGANDEIKVFDGKGGEKKGEVYKFVNSYFQLELTLSADDSLSYTIRNLQSRRQKLDLNFRITMNQAGKPEIITISGPALMPKREKNAAPGDPDYYTGTVPFAKDGKDSPRRGIYRVEQMLTWETAAVKRIDQITIGSMDNSEIAHSHRTYPDGLRPLVEAKEKPALDDKRPGGDFKMPGGAAAPPGAPGIPGFGQGGGAGNVGPLMHGLWKDRYNDVSEQSRRVPVAVALIVDQDHVDRVLTAFNNSKLRFLESQVLVNHYSGSLQPPLPDDKEGGVPGAPPMFPGGSRPEGGFRPPLGGGAPPPFGMPMGGGSPGGPGMGQPGGTSDLETNMEVVIYGFMTLYQRYPPPAAAKKE